MTDEQQVVEATDGMPAYLIPKKAEKRVVIQGNKAVVGQRVWFHERDGKQYPAAVAEAYVAHPGVDQGDELDMPHFWVATLHVTFPQTYRKARAKFQTVTITGVPEGPNQAQTARRWYVRMTDAEAAALDKPVEAVRQTKRPPTI